MPVKVFVLVLTIFFNDGRAGQRVDGFTTNEMSCKAYEHAFANLATLPYVDHILVGTDCVEERAS